MNVKLTHLVAVVLLIAGGFLAYDTVSSSINPYLTVTQVTANPANFPGEIQVLATLSSWSFDDAGALHLTITDGNASIEVYYSGTPPQSMQKEQKIVVIGTLASENSMNATRILTKCPSKYD